MVVSFNRALQAVLIGSALSAAVAHSGSAQAVNRPSVGMMRYPAVSAKQIAFIYSGKLWLVPRNGGVASPLASPPGRIVFPHFSPDGSQIAFSGNYDGNLDLYTLPVNGGVPFRVTHHPASEILCDWCADGKLLFSANYGSGIARTMQLYTVPSSGGLPQKLPVPYGLMRKSARMEKRLLTLQTLLTIEPGSATAEAGLRTSGCLTLATRQQRRLPIGKAPIPSRCGRERPSITCLMVGPNTG
jgi:WD40-like Beta Propeller Repeat